MTKKIFAAFKSNGIRLLLGIALSFPLSAHSVLDFQDPDCAFGISGRGAPPPAVDLDRIAREEWAKQSRFRRSMLKLVRKSATRIAEKVRESCPDLESCNEEGFRHSVRRAIEGEWRALRAIPGRPAVAMIYFATLFGATFSVGFAGYKAEIPPYLNAALTATTGVLIHSMLAEWQETLMAWLRGKSRKAALSLWSPGLDDVWGNERLNYNEIDGVKNGKIINTKLLLLPHLEAARRSLEVGNEKDALAKVANVALTLVENFRSVPPDNPSIQRYVQTWLTEVAPIPEGFAMRAYELAMACKSVDPIVDQNPAFKAQYLGTLFHHWFGNLPKPESADRPVAVDNKLNGHRQEQ